MENIAVYERNAAHLQNDINEFMKYKYVFRKSGPVAEIKASLENGLQPCKNLIADIENVIQIFEQVSKVKKIRLLLTTVNTNMYRKFHIDLNDLRLLCTYHGQYTLWLDEKIGNRNALDNCGDNECIVTDESLIEQVKTRHIAIIKGAIYPKACIQRSPTIEAIQKKRLLLSIDTNKFLNFE